MGSCFRQQEVDPAKHTSIYVTSLQYTVQNLISLVTGPPYWTFAMGKFRVSKKGDNPFALPKRKVPKKQLPGESEAGRGVQGFGLGLGSGVCRVHPPSKAF